MNTFDPQGLATYGARVFEFKHQWVIYFNQTITVINKVKK